MTHRRSEEIELNKNDRSVTDLDVAAPTPRPGVVVGPQSAVGRQRRRRIRRFRFRFRLRFRQPLRRRAARPARLGALREDARARRQAARAAAHQRAAPARPQRRGVWRQTL